MILTEIYQKCEDYDMTEWSELRFEVKELAILESWDWRHQYCETKWKKL
jgi:hypothetical protein